ncbi:hypothetical protein GCM10022221_36230 [Actinocorallia aurea]
MSVDVLLTSFPEVPTIFWGKATGVWRALVHVDGRDGWVTGRDLEGLGHALWRVLRARRPVAAGPAAPRGRPAPLVARAAPVPTAAAVDPDFRARYRAAPEGPPDSAVRGVRAGR